MIIAFLCSCSPASGYPSDPAKLCSYIATYTYVKTAEKCKVNQKQLVISN